jgi:hypothetical protein
MFFVAISIGFLIIAASLRLDALEGVGYASNSAVSCTEVHGPDG